VRRLGKLQSTGLRPMIVERFADDDWHVVDEVVAACGHLIPPEIALRRVREYGGGAQLALGERVEYGRRILIKKHLWRMGAEPGGPTYRQRWDRFRLKRGTYGYVRGERCPHAKVTEAQVREMRARHAAGGVTAVDLAADYGVTPSMVGHILARRSWKHVP